VAARCVRCCTSPRTYRTASPDSPFILLLPSFSPRSHYWHSGEVDANHISATSTISLTPHTTAYCTAITGHALLRRRTAFGPSDVQPRRMSVPRMAPTLLSLMHLGCEGVEGLRVLPFPAC